MRGIPADRCKLPQAFWLAVERIGLSPAAVLRHARLPASLLFAGKVAVSTAQYIALWRAIEELVPQPGLGIRLVEMIDPALHPPSSLAAFYARDYRDGLMRIARFKQICTPEQVLIVEEKGQCVVSIRWLYANEPTPSIATDIAFATFMELGRKGTGQPLVPLRVDLTRPKPDSSVYASYFGCPIRYGAKSNALVLRSVDLDRRFPGHNPELLEMLTPALANALGEIQAQSSISEQVKVVFKRNLASGRPELPDVASELGMSERTLQRRVTEEGKTFRELLAEARQELWRPLLSDPSIDISEVACLLGYQDASSFYRAFKEWEGVTPNRWRELNMPTSSSWPDTSRLLH